MGSGDSFDVDEWRAELEGKRAEKDRFFAEHPQTPIPADERDEFDGLSYFEPDPDYRVTATVRLHDDPDPVAMDTTTGGEMRYRRVATLAFALERDGEDATAELAAYRQEGTDRPSLFVPFRDGTTGQQTHEEGRYVELEYDPALDDGDEVVLDFNLAYAPFCAYNESFECPLPPEENWLEVAIPVGERGE